MPRGDRTGPRGKGPKTGRGLGYCTGHETPGYVKDGTGLGLGLARRNRYGRGRNRRY
nr:MAG: protein of unknown function DUF5320 [Lokiarchaeota virus Skoll Meg22_1214]